MKASIPSSLPINEAFRLLAYLKVKYQPGYFPKSDLSRLSRLYGKDRRTLQSLLNCLLTKGLIGQDSNAFYLRSWRHITTKQKFNLQAFELSLSEIKNKLIFECKLFGAKVTSIGKAIRRGGRVRERGFTHQSPSSGFLAKACQISEGKVSKLKRIAESRGLIAVERTFSDEGPGTKADANILKREKPGIFVKDGILTRRNADKILSNVNTYRIKNRKTWKK